MSPEKMNKLRNDGISAADILKRILKVHSISQMKFAKRIGISVNDLSKIINKSLFISVEIALRIEKVVGISAEWILQLDTNYRLEHTKEPVRLKEDNELFYNVLIVQN